MIRNIKESEYVETMPVSPEMELRHLSYFHINKLSQILDHNESWKSLMEKIPRNLTELQRNDAVLNPITRKYSAENIQQIDETSKQLHRSPTLILLDEWGTSGRKRATVRDLLEILINVHLYRAADFVAMNILKVSAPQRPEIGPGARIDVSLPVEILDEKAIEEILKNAAYPNSSQLAAEIDSTINNNNRDFSNHIFVNHVKSINFFQSLDEFSSEQSESDSNLDLIEFSVKSMSNSNEDASNHNQPQPSQTSQSVFSPGLSSIDFSNLPINLPLMMESDKQSNIEYSQTDESLGEIHSTSSMSIESSKQISNSMEHNQVNSSLIPDITNLQIRAQTSCCNMPISTKDDDTVVTKCSNATDYIPDLSLLNGSNS